MTQDVYEVYDMLCFALAIGLLMGKLLCESNTVFYILRDVTEGPDRV